MKKLFYIGLALMLSVTIVGLSLAEVGHEMQSMIAFVAQDQLKTDNIGTVEEDSTVREFSTPKQLGKSIDEVLLAVAGGCSPTVISLCEALRDCCCDSSPSSNCPVNYPNFFGPDGTCTKCGIICN